MERLTTKNYTYHELDFMEGGVADCFNKLAEYENLMEEYGLKDLTEIENAVQKQTPKQPEILRCNEDIRIGRGVWKAGTSVMKCGSCGEWIVPHWKYCSECGQRIGGSQ